MAKIIKTYESMNTDRAGFTTITVFDGEPTDKQLKDAGGEAEWANGDTVAPDGIMTSSWSYQGETRTRGMIWGLLIIATIVFFVCGMALAIKILIGAMV